MKRYYFETEETKVTKKKGYIEIEENYTQVYDNLLKLTFNMKSITEIQLLFYLCTHSNDQGIFNNNQLLLENFNKESPSTISRPTFYTALQNLCNNKIIIKLTKGQYQLNPLVIWRDSLSNREEHIIEILESDSIKPKYLLD